MYYQYYEQAKFLLIYSKILKISTSLSWYSEPYSKPSQVYTLFVEGLSLSPPPISENPISINFEKVELPLYEGGRG